MESNICFVKIDNQLEVLIALELGGKARCLFVKLQMATFMRESGRDACAWAHLAAIAQMWRGIGRANRDIVFCGGSNFFGIRNLAMGFAVFN